MIISEKTIRKLIISEVIIRVLFALLGLPFRQFPGFVSLLATCHIFFWVLLAILLLSSKLSLIILRRRENRLLVEIDKSGIRILDRQHGKFPRELFYRWSGVSDYCVTYWLPKYEREVRGIGISGHTIIILSDMKGYRHYYDMTSFCECGDVIDTPLFYFVFLYWVKKNVNNLVSQRSRDHIDEQKLRKCL